jgi:phenylalanyl-tRNA synthetase beta subunit
VSRVETMNDSPALQNFLAAYFHQDWMLEQSTPDAVVDYFRDSESPEQVAATRDDLARLLARDLDDATLGDVARELGCEYDPTRDGGSWRGWLESVQARLGA